jgi:folate-binding protein YgfZ
MPGPAAERAPSAQGRDGSPDRAEGLARGEAVADLSFWRKTSVTGTGALDWLNDLVSADLSGLEPGNARPSLLLTPTGHVRAAFSVAATGDGYLLVQDPIQTDAVGALLDRYVLSSEVHLADRTHELCVLAVPGTADPPADLASATVVRPSPLGSGFGLLAPAADRADLLAALGLAVAGDEDLEVWRIRAGITRLGVDVASDDLPQEGAMDSAIAFDKGCYLGQEAVAKVRNLGHPRRLLLSLVADGRVSPGDVVEVAGTEAGQVTSAAPHPAGTPGFAVMARVRWAAREGPFRTRSGAELSPRATDPGA